MLLNFRVSNFRSFRDEVSISFIATRLDPDVGLPTVISLDQKTVSVLPVIAVLGANASGKSNLLRAVESMREVVLTSATRPPYEELQHEPFLLEKACAEEPTMFEIEFTIDGDRFKYGFEIEEGAVLGEWLHTFPFKRAQTLFDRDKKDFTFGKKLGGQTKLLSDITREDVLFLSVGAQSGHELLSRVYRWFFESLSFLDVASRLETNSSMIGRLERKRAQAVRMLSMADLGIVDAKVERSRPRNMEPSFRDAMWNSLPGDLSDEMKQLELDRMFDMLAERQEVKLFHQGTKGSIGLPFEEESLGTKSWMAFVAYALDALDTGGVLLVDELDASLHPMLMARAIQMFQDKATNHRGAQLLFTTHDTTILSGTGETMKLSRGQIWMAEKSDIGNSSIVPLSDFRPRKNEDLERGYLQGRYGGTPRLSSGMESFARRRFESSDG